MSSLSKDIKLETPRLMLRTLLPKDATRAYADWLNDPEVHRYLETKSATLDSVRSFIEAKLRQDNALFLGIFVRDDGRHIGTIKLEPIDLSKREAGIAIMIGERAAWGKGYGTEATRALIRYGFEVLGLVRIELGVVQKNVTAIRSYGKVGFKEIERRKIDRSGRGMQDAVFMAVTPDTFLSDVK